MHGGAEMKKWLWWLLVAFSGAFVSSGTALILQSRIAVAPTALLVFSILIALGIGGFMVAHRSRQEPLSRLEWVVLIWLCLAMAANTVRPLMDAR